MVNSTPQLSDFTRIKLSFYDCVLLLDTLTVFYIGAMELQGSIKIRKGYPGKKNCDKFSRATCYKVISDDLRKHFYHKPQESLPDTRLGLLESRRVALSSHSYSRASKCLKSAR